MVTLHDILCEQSTCRPKSYYTKNGIKPTRRHWPKFIHEAIIRNVGGFGACCENFEFQCDGCPYYEEA